MSHSQLLEQLRQLSRIEKFQMMQFLMAELAKEEGIALGDEVADILGAVHTSNQAGEILRSALTANTEKNSNLASAIEQKFSHLGDFELPTISREPLRKPPNFEDLQNCP